MRFGQKMQQEPRMRPELHTALWSTYLRRKSGAPGALPLLDALATVRQEWHDAVLSLGPTAATLVGTALWDLLGAYRTKRFPQELSELLADVLGLDAEHARDLRTQPAYTVFPPPPRTLILDSTFTLRGDAAAPYTARAALNMCVNHDFDHLRTMLDPVHWPDLCQPFWDRMERDDGRWSGTLNLPLSTGEKLEVVLQTLEAVDDSTESTARLRILPNERIADGRLAFVMRPEASRPGWTRIIHRRDVTFSSDVPRNFHKATVAYWTKSEIACLALQ